MKLITFQTRINYKVSSSSLTALQTTTAVMEAPNMMRCSILPRQVLFSTADCNLFELQI